MEKIYSSSVFGTAPAPYETTLKVTKIDLANFSVTINGVRIWEDKSKGVNIIQMDIYFKVNNEGAIVDEWGTNNMEVSLDEELEGMYNLALEVYLEMIKK
jgi:hypothetical protein